MRKTIVAGVALLLITVGMVGDSAANEPTNNNYSWANGANNQWNGNMTVFSAFALWATWTTPEAITPTGDVDYLLMTCGSAHVYSTGISFTDASGDLDVQFYTPNGTYLGTSNGVGDGESMTFPGSVYSDVVMKIYGWAGATNTYSPFLSCE